MKIRAILPAMIGIMLWAILLLLLGVGPQAAAAPADAPMLTQTALTVSTITRAGITDTLAAANADGSRFSNDGKTFLEVANASGDTITVTVETPGTVDGLAIADLEVAVPDGTTKFIGPFPPSLYNQLAGSYTGYVYVTYSSATTVTVAAWRLNN
jgi:hypothetical protein